MFVKLIRAVRVFDMVVPAGDMFRSFEAAELLSIYWILSTDFTTLKVFCVLCFFILLLLSMRETRHCY